LVEEEFTFKQVKSLNAEIGWRPLSDKIIVVATDEDFHYGGDGMVV